MSLYKRPNSPYWWYRFTAGGRRFRGSTQTEARADAEIIEAQLKRDALLGKILDQKPRIVLDHAFGRAWMEHYYRLPAAKTVGYQMANLKKHLPMSAFVDELTDNHVATFVAKRRAKVTDSTVNRELTILRAVVRMAGRKWGMETPEINWSAHWLEEPDGIERVLTTDQIRRLLEEAAEHVRAPIMFSLMTGVRFRNCVTLDWQQIDMKAQTITFKVKSRKPGGKLHVLNINRTALVLLANLGPKDAGRVFTYKGKPIKSWRTAWENARSRAGLSCRWHDLRHTAASLMVRNGTPLPVVQGILGHEQITTTQRYAKYSPAAQVAAMDAISAAIPALGAHHGHTGTGTQPQQIEDKREIA